MSRIAVPERGAEALFGIQDENLRFLEQAFKVRIKNQGQELVIEGDPREAERVASIFEQLSALMKEGYTLSPGDVRLAADLLKQDEDARLRDYLMRSAVRGGKKVVVPRSLNQRAYLEQIASHDMVFGIGPAGTGKCVASNTLVLTDEGMVEIERLAQGLERGEAQPIELTVHGLQGPEPAEYVYCGGDSATLRIRTRLGYAIETTPEHPLLVLDEDGSLGWRRADALKAGDAVALQRGQRMFGDRTAVSFTARLAAKDHSSKPVVVDAMDSEFAYFLGLLVGDGCLTQRKRIVFTSADPESVAVFQGTAARLGLHVFPDGARRYDHVIGSSGLYYLLEHLGLSLGLARTKRIPRAILTAPEPLVAAFVSALFDTDGTVDKRDGTISFSTVSDTLASQLQTLLLNFGIVANRTVKRGRHLGQPHFSHLLTITGREAERFDALIGFRSDRKRKLRRRRPRNTNVDVLPNVSRLLGLLDERLLFLPVVEIEPSRAHVYDLTVPGTHSFVANGFVNHNTYLAVAQAVSSLVNKQVQRIVLARPAVEAGEKLGFLPGDLQDKVDPYLRPLYDALYDLLDYERVARLLERNAIEVAPIAFMRGRTLNDAFVIIDEAQNTTTEQMKMVLTRTGFGSKVVVTGDITQIDLPAGKTSGLVEAIAVLNGVAGIAFQFFDEKDVVRHKLVQAIVRAYDAHSAGAQTPAR
jgi:phosphate starvation-inducible protein PhoH/intein/homing endonuclease